MTVLVGARGQTTRDVVMTVTGQTTSGSPKMLVVPEHRNRTFFRFTNLSSNPMYLEIGAGEATCTISGGVVTAVNIVNGGFNYTLPPVIQFLGGGYDNNNTTFVGTTAPGYQAPNNQAKALAVLSGGSVVSATILSGGAAYVTAPYVLITNSTNDPNGVADPSLNGGSGYLVNAGASIDMNNTSVTTSPIAVYCATSGSRWSFKWMG